MVIGSLIPWNGIYSTNSLTVEVARKPTTVRGIGMNLEVEPLLTPIFPLLVEEDLTLRHLDSIFFVASRRASLKVSDISSSYYSTFLVTISRITSSGASVWSTLSSIVALSEAVIRVCVWLLSTRWGASLGLDGRGVELWVKQEEEASWHFFSCLSR